MEEKNCDAKKACLPKAMETVKGRSHKVGTVTLGLSLVCMGVLFLAHMFFPEVSYGFIYKLWPVIFILLGMEILLSHHSRSLGEFIYDKTAIVLVALLILFAMLTGIIGMAVEP